MSGPLTYEDLICRLGIFAALAAKIETFKRSICDWLNRSLSTGGRLHCELLDWTKPGVQDQLERIAERFMDIHIYNISGSVVGEVFWPNLRADSSRCTKLSYPRDRAA
jgi:hypothetical protein